MTKILALKLFTFVAVINFMDECDGYYCHMLLTRDLDIFVERPKLDWVALLCLVGLA